MRTLTHRYGHRGLWLILLGLIWSIFGIGLFLQPEVHVSGAFHQYIPASIRAAAWMLTAGVAIYTGLRGRGRDDSLGHLALWLMPALRLLSYFGSWVLYIVSHLLDSHSMGYDRGWYPALVWLFVVTMLRLVAAWPNPAVLPHPPAGAKR